MERFFDKVQKRTKLNIVVKFSKIKMPEIKLSQEAL